MRATFIILLVLITLTSAQFAHAVGIRAGTRLDIVADATYLNAASQVKVAPPSVASVTVSHFAGVLIERDPFSERSIPGQDIYIPMRIRNAGNAEDSFAITATSTRGWATGFVYDDNVDGIHQDYEVTEITETGLVVPDGYTPCFLRVSVPENASQGETITVRATSAADPIRGVATTKISLDAPGALVVSITDPTSDPVYSTSARTVTIRGVAHSGATITGITWSNDCGGSGTCTGATSWYASGIALSTGVNKITVTATDSAQRTATDVLTVNVADTTAPVISISSPTDAPYYVTKSRVINIAGTACDTGSIASVTWKNNLGGAGTCSGTTRWSSGDIILTQGNNVIVVTARNAAGKTKYDTITVNYTPESTAPTIVITSPTTGSTYATTSPKITLSGAASSGAGLASVTWSNSRGGSGACDGATIWTASDIDLESGQNVITVTATDLSGATVTDNLTVTLSEPQSVVVAITAPTAAESWATGNPTFTMAGIASRSLGVTSVSWATDRGASGTCSGVTAWNAIDVPLQPGPNVITVTASDGSQTLGTDLIRVTYRSDTTPPAIDITSPTDQPRVTRNSPILNLRGIATDDTSVTAVQWENDATGASGAAVLTGGAWSADGIDLIPGENPIVVTARDGAANAGSVGLVVTYIDALPDDAWLGRAMVSVPIIPDEHDPKDAVGFYGTSWCGFSTATNAYSVYPNRATWFEPAEQTPGRGFWSTFTDLPAGPQGTIPPQDQPAVIALKTGWNLVGNPFITELRWDITQIMVQELGKSPKPLVDSRHLTNPYLWGWQQDPDDPMTGEYYLIYDSNFAPGVADKLLPWRAYWIKAMKDCYLILPAAT